MNTWSQGANLTEVRGGGTHLHPQDPNTKLEDNLLSKASNSKKSKLTEFKMREEIKGLIAQLDNVRSQLAAEKNQNSSLKTDHEAEMLRLKKEHRQELATQRTAQDAETSNFFDVKEKDKINIGTAGGMTRLSTGYTFLNIQEHSKYIRMNIENIKNIKKYEIGKKYQLLDKIFLKVLKKYPEKMPNIFSNMFGVSYTAAIKFLSNKSNVLEDLSIILKMPKWLFIKSIF